MTSHGKESASSLTVFPYGMIVPASPASVSNGGVLPGPPGYLPYPFPGTSAQMICEFARAPNHFQLYDYQARLQRLGFQGYALGASHGGLGAFQPGPGNFLSYLYGKHERPGASYPQEEPKPSHSYIGIIAMAILSSKEKKLVLSDIYQWILDNYPYFRRRGPGWRNSIRHNLSLNDCFVKSGRSANGKGHYWAIHPANMDDFQKGDFRRRRAQRKVRKAMGLAVPDDEDSPSPSPTPTAALQEWQARMFGIGVGSGGGGGGTSDSCGRGDRSLDGVDSPVGSLTFGNTPSPPHPALPPPSLTAADAEGTGSLQQMTQRFSVPPRSLTVLPRQTISKKRPFDVESLLAPDHDDQGVHVHQRLFLQTSTGLRLAVDRTSHKVALLSDAAGNCRDFPKTIDLSQQTKVERLEIRKWEVEEEEKVDERKNEQEKEEEQKTDEEERKRESDECLVVEESVKIANEGQADEEPSKTKAEDMTLAHLDQIQRSAETAASGSSSSSSSPSSSSSKPEVVGNEDRMINSSTSPSAFRFDMDKRKEETKNGDISHLPTVEAKSSPAGVGVDILLRTRFPPIHVSPFGRARHEALLQQSSGSGRLIQPSAGPTRPALILQPSSRSQFPRFPFQMNDGGRTFLFHQTVTSTSAVNQRGSS